MVLVHDVQIPPQDVEPLGLCVKNAVPVNRLLKTVLLMP